MPHDNRQLHAALNDLVTEIVAAIEPEVSRHLQPLLSKAYSDFAVSRAANDLQREKTRSDEAATRHAAEIRALVTRWQAQVDDLTKERDRHRREAETAQMQLSAFAGPQTSRLQRFWRWLRWA